MKISIGKHSSSAVEKAAAALRKVSLMSEPGAFLGSEPEMLAKLGVSRPTFRQAVKMVALEQLIVTRRGLHGGLYATQPDPSAVVHVAAIYLSTRDATQEHLIRAYPAVFVGGVQMAASCQDVALRQRLAEFDDAERDEGPQTIREFLLRDREFTDLLFEMTGNPVLQLIVSIIYDFSLTFVGRGIFTDRIERAQFYVRARRKLVSAILEGDDKVAAVHARRCQETVLKWLDEDKADAVLKQPAAASAPAKKRRAGPAGGKRAQAGRPPGPKNANGR